MKQLSLFMLVILVSVTLSVASAAGDDTRYRGRFTSGHEISTLQLCGEATTYWVDEASSFVSKLKAYVEKNTAGPYGVVYLMVEGRLVGAAEDGFAADYDDVLAITGLHTLSTQVPGSCELVE